MGNINCRKETGINGSLEEPHGLRQSGGGCQDWVLQGQINENREIREYMYDWFFMLKVLGEKVV